MVNVSFWRSRYDKNSVIFTEIHNDYELIVHNYIKIRIKSSLLPPENIFWVNIKINEVKL